MAGPTGGEDPPIETEKEIVADQHADVRHELPLGRQKVDEAGDHPICGDGGGAQRSADATDGRFSSTFLTAAKLASFQPVHKPKNTHAKRTYPR